MGVVGPRTQPGNQECVMAAIASIPCVPQSNRILVASANAEFRKYLLENLPRREGRAEEAVGGAHALAKLNDCACDSVLLDKHLPDLDANEVAGLIRKRYPRIVVEMVDSRQENETRQESTADEQQVCAVATTEESKRAVFEAEELHVESEALPGMIGWSRAIQQVYSLVRMVAPRDTTVLLSGETGTGKELAAVAVHQLSRRARQPFVVLNCAAIPEALLEAELFGHVRGAFTGAVQSRLGRIHVAQGGTLFLDEIGELPLAMQAKLLRFLQNGEVQRLGSSDVYKMDVRVICATNARLAEQVQARQFRQDLYYRLAVFPVHLPALRHRLEDVKGLATHFLEQLEREAGVRPRRISHEVLRVLSNRCWPGNVRELQHALERAFILAGNGEALRAEHCREPQD